MKTCGYSLALLPEGSSDEFNKIFLWINQKIYNSKLDTLLVYTCRKGSLRGIDTPSALSKLFSPPTFTGRQLCQNYFHLPSEKGSSLKGKNLLPEGANSFLLE